MSLKSIRASIAAEAGYHPDSSTDDKAYLNSQINQVASELYSQHDLTGSLAEVIAFFTDFTEKLISTPWYVATIRASRYYDCPMGITLRDIRPRYATDGWSNQLFDYREIGTSSLAIQLSEWSSLVFSLPEGEVSEKDIIISVVGQTPVASQVEEQVTLVAGQNSVTTVNNWIEAPRVIEKNTTNNFDILVADVNENELAIIPNSELQSRYTIWQVQDDSFVNVAVWNSMEILYKERFRPLVNDYDEFLSGKYDEVLIWKFLDEYWSKQEGKGDLAIGANARWVAKLGFVNQDKGKGKKIELQTVPNKFYGLFQSQYYRAGKQGYN